MNNNPLKDIIKQEVSCVTKEFLTESFRGFRLTDFKKLDSKKKMAEYAEKYLPFLNSGSSRLVFGLGSGKVLKIAIDDFEDSFGVQQNITEVELFTKNKAIGNYITKIYSFDNENYYWIITEAVKIFEDNKDILSKFTIPEDFLAYFTDACYENSSTRAALESLIQSKKTDKDLRALFKGIKLNDLDKKLLRATFIVIKHGIVDVESYGQWGMTIDGRIVLADYGLE